MAVNRSVQFTPDFDSELGASADADNATPLTVILRIAFDEINPSGGSTTRATTCRIQSAAQRVSIGSDWAEDLHGRVFRIQEWRPGELSGFTWRFKRLAEEIWNDKFFILFPNPNDPSQALSQTDFEALQSRAFIGQKRPFLRCRLRIESVDARLPHHALMHVIKLAPGQGCSFQSFVAQRLERTDEGFLTNQDDAYACSHETGHLLGLHHVNDGAPGCARNPHAEICYGETELQQRDVMGTGTVVHGGHALRWLQAIALHTGHSAGWRATNIEPPIEELLQRAIRSDRIVR